MTSKKRPDFVELDDRLKSIVCSKKRTIDVFGPITEKIAKKVHKAMDYLESLSKKTITLNINSEGGCSVSGDHIAARILESPCRITTKGYGEVGSAAFTIFLCGDKRYAHHLACFMYHQSAYALEDRTHGHGNYAQYMEYCEARYADFVAERTGHKNGKWWRMQYVKGDKWFTSDELLEYGVINELF